MSVPPLLLPTLERLEAYRQADAHRQQYIEELTRSFISLQTELETIKGDLDDERATKRQYKKRAEELELSIQRKFVLVLVDGDGYIFKKAFIEAVGVSGGSHAANALYTEVQNYLRTSSHVKELGPDWDVLVIVYANKSGLAKTLIAANFLDLPSQLDQFFCTFSQSRSLFHFIDCGFGKERADSKIRDTLRFYAYNAQCQQIFLACCHDNGYIAELDKYRHDPVVERKVILVHAAQSHQTMRAYASLPFSNTTFDGVFETTPLDTTARATNSGYHGIGNAVQDILPSVHENPDVSPAPSRSSHSSASGVPATAKSLTNLTLATARPEVAVATPVSAQSQSGSAPFTAKNGIPINRFGQRIDLKLRMPTKQDLEKFDKRIRSRKLCNEHHLRDSCYSYNCRFDHDEIDAAMRNTLRNKARTIACSEGSKCRIQNCFHGHHCPWGADECSNFKCPFEKNGLHDIRDLEIVRFVEAART